MTPPTPGAPWPAVPVMSEERSLCAGVMSPPGTTSGKSRSIPLPQAPLGERYTQHRLEERPWGNRALSPSREPPMRGGCPLAAAVFTATVALTLESPAGPRRTAGEAGSEKLRCFDLNEEYVLTEGDFCRKQIIKEKNNRT